MKNMEPVKPEKFVQEVIERIKTDNALAARLRRADNPGTEDQSYGFLVSKNIDITDDKIRLPYALIGAAICKQKKQLNGNGTAGIGAALAASFQGRHNEENSEDKAGSNRLGRMLTCRTIPEVCAVLRPILPFVADNSALPLDYARLLIDLIKFESPAGDTIRRRWAREFYSTSPKADTEKQE